MNKSINIFLRIFAINWICCQFLQHYAAAASEGAGPRRNFWTSPRMQTSFWNSQTANFFSPIFKEFNKPFNLTFFVCLLFLERENSFRAELPLKIEIFLYCNKIFIPSEGCLWRQTNTNWKPGDARIILWNTSSLLIKFPSWEWDQQLIMFAIDFTQFLHSQQ